MAPPAADEPIAAGYPVPMVDHARERDRTLAMFQEHDPAGWSESYTR